jgi:acylphosphatase
VSDVARRLVVRGRVQGVGYRHAAVQAAAEAGVTGWIRNRSDGTVEAFVQGSPVAVEAFAAWCRRGPPLARVTDVESEAAQPDSALDRFEWRSS